MDKKLREELIRETHLEDIAETYRPVAEIVGVERFVRLSEYACGDEIYFPKPENILVPARNRRIQVEYNGYNIKQLAEKYELTTKQIGFILRDVPVPGQLDIFDWLGKGADSSENTSPKEK